MITVTVTSDSNLNDLRLARIVLDELTARLEVNMFDEAKEFKVPERVAQLKQEISEHLRNEVNDSAGVVFNATELAEAEALGKSAHSTVAAEASQTVHADTPVTTSTPAPTTVFGQPAQNTVNEANPVAQTTDSPVRDANGLVWDERIHSSSKEFVKDGTWRKRRGVSDDIVAQVEAELRGVPKYPAVDVTQVYANVTGKSFEQSEHELNNGASVHSYNDGETVVIDPDGGEHSAPVDHSHDGETPVFTATIPTEMSFTELLDGVTKAMVAGQLTQQRINEALQSIGLTALPNLLGNTALIPAFREALGGVV